VPQRPNRDVSKCADLCLGGQIAILRSEAVKEAVTAKPRCEGVRERRREVQASKKERACLTS